MRFAIVPGMTTNKPLSPAMEAPLAQLEQSLIREYLLLRGHDSHSLQGLADSQREALLKEASTYASDKLCEIEVRSRFVHGLHEAIGDLSKAGKA